MSHQQLMWLKTTFGLTLIFAIAAYRYDLRTALAFVSSCLAGWLNVFGALHAFLALVRHQPVSVGTSVAVGIALILSVALAFFGYWLLLALTTSCVLLIDAAVLRFAGPPIGQKVVAGEP
jgi:hypothetical protein